MPEKKNQHFVPKFLLKNFSNNGNESHIGLYNFNSNVFIRNAEIRGQSKESYFYGKDGKVEEWLGALESESAKVLRQILNSEKLPQYNSEDYKSMWLFTLVQLYRTKNKSKEINDIIDKTLKTILKNDIRFQKTIDEYNFMINETPSYNLGILMSSLEVVNDLSCKLIVNRTQIPFINSDNPVITYNQFLEKRRFPAGREGLATKGLQIFFPIYPKLLLMFYDKKVYKVGNKKQYTIETHNLDDINSFNLLQALNCDEIIYFNHEVNEDVVKKIELKRNSVKNKENLITNEFDEIERPDGTFSKQYHFYGTSNEINLELSFVKATKSAKNYELTGYAAELRNEKLRGMMSQNSR